MSNGKTGLRKIAAVPELLAACKLAEDLICGRLSGVDPENLIVLPALRAAVSKAEEEDGDVCDGVQTAALSADLVKEAVGMLERVFDGYGTMIFLLDMLMPGWRRDYNFHRTRAEIGDLLDRIKGEVDHG